MIKMPNKLLAAAALNLLAFSTTTQALPPATVQQLVSAYRQYKDITVPDISVPTVVEVSLADAALARFDVAVLNQAQSVFEPHYFRQETFRNQIPMSVTANAPAANAQAMLDADPQTYTEFTVPADAAATAQIILTSEQPITSASLTFLLDSNVALPNSIAVHASDEAAGEKIIVAPRELGDQTIAFPKTTAKQWTITLSHSQLLRITELRLHQENAAKQSTNAVRFLAQPAHTYRVYFDPDRYSAPPVGEAGNLTSDTDVVILPAIAAEPNPAYVIADVDQDGVPDIRDNCVNIANADQQDKNANKRGDACDDFDRDGLSNTIDNCPDAPNRNQADADGDGLGDVCDTEESRLTERYAWLPWLGIGSAAVVLIILFTITGRSVINYRDHDKNSSPPPNVNAT